MRRATLAGVGTIIGVMGFSGIALATDTCPEPPPPPAHGKCNSGNGNGSEPAGPRCNGGDPGNSFNAGNRGGDEGGTPRSNPGGNNVP